MRVLLIFLIILFSSCLFNKDKNVVDVSNISEKIYIGMSKNDLIEKLGLPKDSIMSEIIEEGIYYYKYDTNDFTGYTLKIWFNSENQVSYYRVD